MSDGEPTRGEGGSGSTGGIVLGALTPVDLPSVPLGLLQLHACLQQAGVPMRVARLWGPGWPRSERATGSQALPEPVAGTYYLDLPVEERLRRIQEAAQGEDERWRFDAWVEELLEGGEPVVGLSVFRTNVDATLEVARRLKERAPDLVIVLGGAEALEAPDDLRQPFVDEVVSQPGWDAAVGALLEACGSEGDLALADGLPPIDYEYAVRLVADAPNPSLPVRMGLGCRYRCRFCTDRKLFGAVAEPPDVARLLGELDRIEAVWRACPQSSVASLSLFLCDSMLDGHGRAFDELCEALSERGGYDSVVFQGFLGLNRPLSRENAEHLVRAKFTRFCVGLEAGSPAIRKRMGKPPATEPIVDGINALMEAGVEEVGVALIVGWPEETEADYYQSLEVLEQVAACPALRWTVQPPIITPGGHDLGWVGENQGAKRGILWRTDGPGGDPEIRCRRLLGVLEHFAGMAEGWSNLRPDLAVEWMLEAPSEALVARWSEDPTSAAAADPNAPDLPWRAFAAELGERLAERLPESRRVGGWELGAVVPSRHGALVAAVHPGAGQLGLIVTPAGELGQPAYARCGDLEFCYSGSVDAEHGPALKELLQTFERLLG